MLLGCGLIAKNGFPFVYIHLYSSVIPGNCLGTVRFTVASWSSTVVVQIGRCDKAKFSRGG